MVLDEQEFAENKAASANAGNKPAVSQSVAPQLDNQGTYASGFMNIPDGVEDDGLPFN